MQDSNSVATKQPYDNCRLLNAEGKLLSRCNRDRIQSYLKRGLGEIVSSDPLTMRLPHVKFETVQDPYSLQDKLNKCVVCEAESNLTKHHVVPSCYKVYFPDDLKNNNHHDILVLCNKCHRRYEGQAYFLREELRIKSNRPENISDLFFYKVADTADRILHITPLSDEEEKKYEDVIRDYCGLPSDAPITAKIMRGASRAPLSKKGHKVAAAIQKLKKKSKKSFALYAIAHWRVMDQYFGRRATDAELRALVDMRDKTRSDGFTTDCQRIVSQYDPQEFSEIWRRHFLATMSPKFLPENWSEKRVLGSFGTNSLIWKDKNE